MKIRPLVIGLTLTTTMLVAGCDGRSTDKTSSNNPDLSSSPTGEPAGTGTDTGTGAGSPPSPAATGSAATSGTSDTAAVGQKLDDSVITTKVRTALLADASIKSTDIEVNTTNGEVHLSGKVENQSQIDQAVEAARKVEGVKNVKNELSVKQPTS
ncbi:MAG TPA: BON domain-containing protein [Methylophilaceae bacterium]|nr:BON domain-containing protein [Methylophilaceae bacterium]